MVQAAIGGILASLGIAAFFVGLQIVLFRVLGKLALDYSGLGSLDDAPVYALGDALQALPAWTLQLMNWMYLDQSIMIISAALIFAAAVRFFFGGSSNA
ncbi:MAG: hypothetical protein J6Y56_07550 [Fibrobacterales bacterium]|nr:hypothetical protein [Fibrobacterales bacterium]